MQALYFILAAVILYFLSDRILERIEIARGRRFDERTIVFFMILLTLSLITFSAIGWLTGD